MRKYAAASEAASSPDQRSLLLPGLEEGKARLTLAIDWDGTNSRGDSPPTPPVLADPRSSTQCALGVHTMCFGIVGSYGQMERPYDATIGERERVSSSYINMYSSRCMGTLRVCSHSVFWARNGRGCPFRVQFSAVYVCFQPPILWNGNSAGQY